MDLLFKRKDADHVCWPKKAGVDVTFDIDTISSHKKTGRFNSDSHVSGLASVVSNVCLIYLPIIDRR